MGCAVATAEGALGRHSLLVSDAGVGRQKAGPETLLFSQARFRAQHGPRTCSAGRRKQREEERGRGSEFS